MPPFHLLLFHMLSIQRHQVNTHRVSKADGADVAVGLPTILIGAGAEGLGPRVQLHMALYAHHSLVVGLPAWDDGTSKIE